LLTQVEGDAIDTRGQGIEVGLFVGEGNHGNVVSSLQQALCEQNHHPFGTATGQS
jgi:hypothetical protein